jgi:hypothetical protein
MRAPRLRHWSGQRGGAMKHWQVLAVLVLMALVRCGDSPASNAPAPVERRPFVLLQDSSVYNVTLVDGYAPPTHGDGSVLGFRYDDTSITVTSPTVTFPDCLRLLVPGRFWGTGRLDAFLGAHRSICDLPYSYCPFTARFTMHGISDSLSYDYVDDSGRVSVSFRDSTALLAKGDTFQIVEWVLHTGCLVQAGASLVDCSQAVGDTVLYYVDSVTHTITLTNKGIYDWDQIHDGVPAPEP